MNPLEHLSVITGVVWPRLRHRARADGCGRLLDVESERVAAFGELVALTLPELPSLGALAMLAECHPEPCPEFARVVSREAADVLRLVDAALAAHGRAHGYPVSPWLDRAFAHAEEHARVVAHLTFAQATDQRARGGGGRGAGRCRDRARSRPARRARRAGRRARVAAGALCRRYRTV